MTSDPIGAALLLAAPLGVAGVFVLALFERMVPVLPSTGLFVGIGVAAAEGLWCLHIAVVASVLGSATGAVGAFALGFATRRSERGGLWRLFWRRDRWGRALRRACRSAAAVPFKAQLLPATRTLAPLVGGVIRHDRTRFLLATAAGLTLWNMAFITSGFVLVRLGGPANATLLSVALGALVVASFAIARLARGRAASPWPHRAPNNTGHRPLGR